MPRTASPGPKEPDLATEGVSSGGGADPTGLRTDRRVWLAHGVFFDLKSRREESWLDEHVAGYAAYREGRRKLIPWIY
jgi:hypothetical protein